MNDEQYDRWRTSPPPDREEENLSDEEFQELIDQEEREAADREEYFEGLREEQMIEESA